MTRPGRRSRLAGSIVAAGLLAAACTTPPTAGPATTSAAPTPSASGLASPSPAPTSTPTPTFTVTDRPEPAWRSPLDGVPGYGPEPVLVVKLDNTRFAQPHAGLTRADVVYLEEVEYGITRIAAVFSERIPTRIGPVRSARITDIDLLAQYGKPAFAYSGAQRKMFPVLDAAPFLDVSPRGGAEGYSRDSSRYAPYNYYLDGRVALKRAPNASLSRDLGFVFDDEVPPGGLAATSARMRWGYASAEFDYRPKRGTYRVILNDLPAQAEESDAGQQADTVVIQYVKQTPSAYFDKGGGNTPHAQTIGSGTAVVMRDGLAWETRWSRPTAKDGTTFTLPDGSAMPFKPGQTWIILMDRTRPATVKPMTPPRSSTASAATSVTDSPQ